MKNPQSFFMAAGDSACYALQLYNVAQKIGLAAPMNEQAAIELGIESGVIEYHAENWHHPRNFLVIDAGKFVTILTMRRYAARWDSANYKAKPGEHVIQFWAKSKANADKGIGHFDAPDYHTLQRSVTVETGKVYSTRVIYPKG
ncbi:MAG: hypothetical protein IJ191_09140 [Treponema sp.]|nr:hypothetical protein [Treponema sp.]